MYIYIYRERERDIHIMLLLLLVLFFNIYIYICKYYLERFSRATEARPGLESRPAPPLPINHKPCRLEKSQTKNLTEVRLENLEYR